MSDNKYLRLTIDVCVFAEDSRSAQRVAAALLDDGSGSTVTPSEDGKTIVRKQYHPWGTGEQLARRFMEQVVAGHIEIDDIRDVEDHTD